MVPDIDQLQEAVAAIRAAGDLKALEELRVRYTGRRSQLRQVLGSIGSLPADERRSVGQSAGKARKDIEAALGERQQVLESEQEAGDALDVTLPGRVPRQGQPHPLSATADELVVSKPTLGYWLLKLGSTVRRGALAPGESLEVKRAG